MGAPPLLLLLVHVCRQEVDVVTQTHKRFWLQGGSCVGPQAAVASHELIAVSLSKGEPSQHTVCIYDLVRGACVSSAAQPSLFFRCARCGWCAWCA